MRCQICGNVLGCENCDYLVPDVKSDIVIWNCTVNGNSLTIAQFTTDFIYSCTMIHLEACASHSAIQKVVLTRRLKEG